MHKRKIGLAAGSIVLAVAIATVALAVEEFNSSRSNVSTSCGCVEKDGPPLATYSYAFNFSLTPNNRKLTQPQFALVIDEALVQVKKDMVLQYTGAATPRDSTSAAVWTPWLSRDTQGGSGDYEDRASFVASGQACEAPTAIECRTKAGVDWRKAGQKYTCDKDIGGVCRNDGQRCEDYEVRFLCPAPK